MMNMKRPPPIARTHGTAQHISVVNLRPSHSQVQWALLMGLVFLVTLFIDWRSGIYIFSKVQAYIVPALTILFPLLCIGALAGQMQSVVKQNAIAKFSLYVLWFVLAILIELALSNTSNSVPLEGQFDAYLSFARLILWALAGYLFVQRREDATWLLHRFAVGMACICALSYLLIAAGQSGVAVATQTETVRLQDAAERGNVIGLPNWGAHGFLLFGYCWFLTRTLFERRWLSWSTAGLLACCELWVQMMKSTLFGIVPGTLAISALLLLKTRRGVRALVMMAVIVGLAAGGIMIANEQSGGELANRALGYAANRFLRVKRLDLLDESLSEIMTRGSSGRLSHIWPEAIQRFETSPVFGCGFNQDFGGGAGGLLPIHNAYLDVLVGVGLFGALPVLLGFLWWFRTVWKAVRLPENTVLCVSCLGYAICFCAINAGDLLRYFYTPMMFLGLMLGVAMKVALLPPMQGGGRQKLGSVDRT